MIEAILVILTLHFLGDFVFQSDKMAINKSKSCPWLVAHVLVYTAMLWLAFPLFPTWTSLSWWVVMNGGLHVMVDFVTSKATSKLWALNQRHWFFVAIGGDQLLHYICLFITWWAV